MAIPADSTPGVRFLGREHELDRLKRRLEATLSGRGGLVLVTGPSGVGLTSLAREAAERAHQAGMAVVWGRCLEGTLGRPYGGLADALEAHAVELAPATVVAEMAADAGPIVRICPALARLVPALVPAVPLDPDDERLRLHEAVWGWISRMANRQAVLLVVDDAHLADADLAALLENLARRARNAPLLVLCTVTLGPGGPGGGHGGSRPRMPVRSAAVLEKLELDGLDVGATGALVAGLADLPVAPATVELVQQVTAGVPAFSIELFRHLREEGLLPSIRGGRLPEVEELPQTLEEVVSWRIARLAPESRATLNVLAAFPDGAGPNLLAAAAGLTRARSGEALDSAVMSGLATSAEHGTIFAIAQPAIRRGLLEKLAPTLRAQLHRRVAETIATESDDRSRELAGVLAHHYAASKSLPGRDRGVRHCLLAAEQARTSYSYRRQADCLRWAVELAADLDPRARADLLGRLATAEATAGLRNEALRSGRLLLEQTPGHAGDSVLGAIIDTLRALRGTGVAPADWPDLESLRAYAATRAERAEPANAARLQLMVERWQALDPSGIAVMVWSDPQPAAAKSLWDAADEIDRAEVMLAQRPRNKAETAAALDFARTVRRPQTALRTLHAAVTDLVWRHGLFAEGASWAAQFLASAERHGSPRDQARALLALARCQAALGDLAESGASIERTEELLGRIPEAPSLTEELVLARLALSFHIDDDWPARSKSFPSVATARPAALLFTAQAALVAGRLGYAEDARAAIPPVLEAAAELLPLTLYRDAALVCAAEAAWEIGAAEHAPASRSLVELAAEGGVGGQLEGTLGLTRARMLALSGELDEARQVFAAERTSLAAAGLRPQAALCDHDEAIALAAAGAGNYVEATRLLQSAADQFRHIGMTGWLARANEMVANGLEAAAVPGGRLTFTYPRGLTRHEADLVRLLAHGAGLDDAEGVMEIEHGPAVRLLDSALEKLGAESADELPGLARQHGLGGV